jgi:hypothetical protein
MSAVCHLCPTCGSADVKTRLVTPMVARCLCLACRHVWNVAIERIVE